jgi:hypothetical protein
MFKCDLCYKEFKFKSKFEEHNNKKKSCDKPKISYNCEICKVEFNHKSHLERHEQTVKHISTNTNINKTIKQDIELEEIIKRVYLLKDTVAIRSNENVYKIGKTSQQTLNRFSQYPKGSKVLLLIACNNCNETENNILKLFKKKYKNRIDYGNEYFEGNYKEMTKDIINLVI